MRLTLTAALVLLLILAVSSQGIGKVTDEECNDAYELCIILKGGYLPPPHGNTANMYCATGLVFCLVFMT